MSAPTFLRAYDDAAAHRPWLAPPLAESCEAPPTDLTALDLFKRVDASAEAVVYFDRVFAYGELDLMSDRLASWWAARGVARGDRVAIILQNTPQFLIATLAAWKLVAIPVCLNPMYRPYELAKLFADCAPRAVVCQDEVWSFVIETARGLVDEALLLWTSGREQQSRDDARVLPARAGAPPERSLLTILETPAEPPPAVAPAADDVGLLLYTSGTTGVPKGAMLTHRNLVHNGRICSSWFKLTKSSRVFGVAPLFHITGFEIQLVAAFDAGACQLLNYRFHPTLALEAFLEHRPTFIIGAITAFIALANQPEAEARHFASFDRIYSGGAPIPPSVVDAFARRFGRAIRTSYGMTELTAPSHLAPADGAIPVDAASGALSIGRPTPGTDVIVVDENRNPVGPREHGELVARGPQVMAGYWNKPKETAEVLSERWMHTGDIGFFDEAGWFYLVDRKKDMISASGFKVWPREVEDVLYAYPGVREAAVIGVPDDYRGETVAAFVSTQAGVALDVGAIERFCRERLAAYKIPRAITVLPDLPKTATGKIMRVALKGAPRD